MGVEWAEWSEPPDARSHRWPAQWLQDVAARLSPDLAWPAAEPGTARPVDLILGLDSGDGDVNGLAP